MRIRDAWLAGVVLLAASGVAPAAGSSDPCTHFVWNVTRELALFASTPVDLHAGKDRASAPRLAPDRLYQLALTPQDQVSFPLAPGKKALADGAYAGLARVTIHHTGLYRVALDTPFWIDVIAHGRLLASTDFTGNHQCHRPRSLRKLVEFRIPAGQVLLQLSGGPWKQVRLTVTRSPKR